MEKTVGVIALLIANIIVNVLIAWVISELVSYIFNVEFGFWKGVSSLILLWLVGVILRPENSD